MKKENPPLLIGRGFRGRISSVEDIISHIDLILSILIMIFFMMTFNEVHKNFLSIIEIILPAWWPKQLPIQFSSWLALFTKASQ